MAGPIGEAYVRIRADVDTFRSDLSRATDPAFGDVRREANATGEAVEDAFQEAARQVDDALDRIGGADVWADVAIEAEAAGERIDDSFREAARQSDAALDNIGGVDAYGPAVIGAEVAGERIDNSFREAAVQSNGWLATIGTGAALAGVTALVAAVGGLSFIGVNSAADLNESINAIEVTLGDGADAFLAFSEDAAAALGITQGELNQSVVPLGALLRNAGLEGDALGNQLAELSERAADVGSVMNTDVNDVLLAFGSAVRGEMEPARALGVSFDDAAVQAKALEMGLAGANGEVDEGAKAQARLALILEQTEHAAGDFANTADNLPNMLRRLKATGEEAAQSLGVALIPSLEAAGNAVIDALPDLTPYLESIGTSLGGFVETLAPLLGPAIGQVASIFSSFVEIVTPIVEALGPPVTAVLAGLAEAFYEVSGVVGGVMDSLGPVLGQFGTVIGEAVAALGPLVGVVLQALAPVLGVILQALIPVIDAVGQFAGILADALAPIVEALTPVIEEIGLVFSEALASILPDILRLVEAAADVFADLAPILGEVAAVMTDVASTIMGAFVGALFQIIDALVPIMPMVGELVTVLLEALLPVFPELVPAVLSLVEASAALLLALIPLLPPILELATLLIERIGAPLLIALAEALAFVVAQVAALAQVIAGAIAGITGNFSAFLSFIGEIPSRIGGFLSGLPGQVRNLIGDAFTTAKNVARGAIDDLVGYVTGLPGRVSSAAGNMWNFLGDTLRSVLQRVANLWNNFRFPSWTMPSVSIPGVGTIGGSTIGGWSLPQIRVPQFHMGGIVPGYPGTEVLALLKAGETVLATQPGGRDAGRYGFGVSLTFQPGAIAVALASGSRADAAAAGRTIGDAIADRVEARLAGRQIATTARLAEIAP